MLLTPKNTNMFLNSCLPGPPVNYVGFSKEGTFISESVIGLQPYSRITRAEFQNRMPDTATYRTALFV